MTPAEELRIAATKLRRFAAQATEAPWTTHWNAQEYELVGPSRPYPIAQWTYAIVTQGPHVGEQRAECDTADADYIAAMHPGVGAALAKWLESWVGIDFSEHAAMAGDLAHALAVARQINRSQP